MLIITKENNSIKVVGQNNPTYPYSGTLVYPLNSVTVVTDQSDMAVFRSALNNDVLFTGLIDDITIAGSTVTKEDIGTKFGAIANSSSSGGGGTGGGAVDSVNGQTGTVVLSASDVNAYSKTESDEKYATKAEIPSTDNLATKEELALKADKSSLGDYLLKTEAQSNYETISGAQGKYATKQELAGEVSEREKQDSALGGMIAGETEAREQAITNLTATVQGKLDTATYNSEKATFETKENAAATYQPKGEYLTSIPENYVTDEELNGKGYATTEQLNAKQDTLVSGTNIKTVNGNSLLGSGDITIEGGTGSGVKEWDFAQLQSDNEYRNNFIANAKVSDIINNVLHQSTTYDHCSILCIKGSTYTLLLNNELNPMIAPLTVIESTALISSAINIYTIVDSTLSDDSINPVQNKVIKAELDKKANAKRYDLSTYGGAINAGDTLTNVGNYGLLKVFVCVYTDLLNVIAIGLNAEGKDIVINLKNENVSGAWKWNVKSEIEIGGGTGGSGIATWDYAQLQSDQEYRTNFLSNVKVSDDLINLGGSDNPEHASILTIDNNVYTVMYNVGGNPKVTSINIQESGATITNIDAIPKNVATTSENGLMSSADKTKLDSIDVASILSRITALETQMGEVSAKLDNINGEVVA